MKFLIFIFLFTILNFELNAQDTTISTDIKYEFNKLDSENTAEILALNRARMYLVYQVEKYLDSTNLKQNILGLESEEVKILIPCIIEIDVTERTVSEKEIFLNLQTSIDKTILLKRLNKCSQIDEEVSRITKIKTRANDANIQIESLKRATFSDAFYQAEFQFLIEYVKNINILKEEELFQNGYLAYLNMEFDSSICHFEKMTKLNPENDLGYYYLALNYEMLGNDDKAISYFEKTLELSPKFAEATYKLGVLYTKNGNEYYSSKYLNQAARLNHQKAKKLLGPF